MKFEDKFTIGKYAGKTPTKVSKKDAQYVIWAERIGWLIIPQSLRRTIEKRADREHADFLREYCDNEQCIEY